VQDIRTQLFLRVPQAKIAAQYGISEVMVRNIKRGVMWGNVPDPYNLAETDFRDGKLTDQQVLDIRRDYDAKIPRAEIAAKYGTSKDMVANIGARRNYRKVPEQNV
jgi:hypothetical protein